MQDWIAASISEEQKRPFASLHARSSILAAAGSGKTRTLTHLLAHDLCSGVPASGIVAFTFTDKAAEELSARIHVLRDRNMRTVDLSGMFIGTIHSWCLQYIYSQPQYYNMTPLDELHVEALAARLFDPLRLSVVYGKPFPRALGPFLADIEIFYNEHLALESVPPSIRPVLTTFLSVLEENRLVTFGGMVRTAAKHLEKTGPLDGLHSLYVDEYQDVNPAQASLIRAMITPTAKLHVVGDDLQSIYNWRGSDVTRILRFSEEFAPAETFRLTTNHRSRPEVVTVANSVAEDIVLRDPLKVMQSGRESCRGAIVHWLSTTSEEAQAETIADIVQRFHNNGVEYSKIAILLRSVSGSGRPIHDALLAEDIPVECPMLGRGGTFIESFVLPVLQWLRTEQVEPRNGEEEAEMEAAANSLWLSAAPWLGTEKTEDVFWTALNEWHDLVWRGRNSAYNVRGCLYDFLDACGVRVASSDGDLMVAIGIASQIVRSVEEIHRRRLSGQPRRSPLGVVNEVYYALHWNSERFGESAPVDRNTEGVMLTTVHQAKGLEWPIVCLPMLNRRRFPVTRRRAKGTFPLSVAARYGTELDDERRLFYVAVTRARERLFFLDTAAQSGRERSTFLTDLQRKGTLPAEGMPGRSHSTWTIASSDLRTERPAPIRVSLSDLLLYLECPYQFGLRRVSGVQPAVGDELGFGKGLHELLQRRAESDHAWHTDEVLTQTTTHVHLPLSSAQSEKIARQAISKSIQVLDDAGAFDGELQQELPVEVVVGNGVVAGIVDSVYVHDDGSVTVRDWKANVHDTFVMRYRRQLQFYAHALRLAGWDVRRAELVDVAASTKAKKLITIDVCIDETEVGTLLRACDTALRNIHQGAFEPTPSVTVCGACDVRRICSAREEHTNGEIGKKIGCLDSDSGA